MRRQRSIWTTGLVLPKVKPCMANQASWSAPWRLAGLRLALTLTAPWSHQGAAVRSSALSWRWEPIRRGSRWNDIIISQVVLLQTHRPQRAAGGSAADASPTEGSRWFCCRRFAHRGQRMFRFRCCRPSRLLLPRRSEVPVLTGSPLRVAVAMRRRDIHPVGRFWRTSHWNRLPVDHSEPGWVLTRFSSSPEP
ncbi:uncharacterized protein LOC119776801 isoform X7 [Cyprinodon tularosa]|uniref:uncharacterized protein LOC119776801 isoform X3 n=1 Tax=Cyprinodon tularosa TaxID=77115 RepID=UPI0018E27840|nr:uncharacterized protein LOC119776801 isoform X3 [Cyprinodon tularosa]XP_038131336.1 uncharacterized protein LOC119776801 isoform X5 [Cyprinodon tularosa]XP_038131337.1 uncharacterized protein LOC119776801 isoform X6 [Cyprinodon tularosa]XP_038131338.1 uncharacterized protein LOC119776801 isoform X7 [Cyprinodon tularosa]